MTINSNAKNALGKLTLEEFKAVVALGKMIKGQYDAPEFTEAKSMAAKYEVVYTTPDIVDTIVDRAGKYTGKKQLIKTLKRKVEAGKVVFWEGYSSDIKDAVMAEINA